MQGQESPPTALAGIIFPEKGPGTGIAKDKENQEESMTLTLTPSLTIRIRRAADNARRVIRTHTRHLSITSLSFLKLEVMVFKYRGK